MRIFIFFIIRKKTRKLEEDWYNIIMGVKDRGKKKTVIDYR